MLFTASISLFEMLSILPNCLKSFLKRGDIGTQTKISFISSKGMNKVSIQKKNAFKGQLYSAQRRAFKEQYHHKKQELPVSQFSNFMLIC